MKRARFAAVCSSTAWGGTEKWVLRACEELNRRGREVTLIVRDRKLFQERSRTNLSLVRMPLRNDGDFASVLRLAGLLRRQADVVVVTRVRDYWLGGLAARLAGVPVLLRLGVVRSLRENNMMDRMRYGVLPHSYLVNAEAIRETLLETEWLKKDRIHVVYNGVDAPGKPSETERTEARKLAGVGENEVMILAAGRLAVEKRWNWLVDSLQILLEKGLPVTVRLLGRGNERGKIMRRVRERGVGEKFLLPGETKDVRPWLQAADIVALPSSNEGISNTMLEAMGCGLPVVATSSGGVEEVFADDRDILLAETDSFAGFVERLKLAVSRKELRERIGAAGLKTVRERFTWEKMTDALESLLDSMAGES